MKSKKSIINLVTSLIIVFLCFCVGYSHAGVLITEQHLTYQGAFRVPYPNLGGDSSASRTMGRGGAAPVFNPANNSLIMMTGENQHIELSIPDLVISDTITGLNSATVIQAPMRIVTNWSALGLDGASVTNGGRPGDNLLYNNRLIGSAWAYYSTSNYLSHYSASPTWSTSGSQFSGLKGLGETPGGSIPGHNFVGGFMALVPDEWQTQLGYPAITGQGAISIISRSSSGPAAYGFNPDDVGINDPAVGEWFIVYPDNHSTLGNYSSAEPSLYFNRATYVDGVVFPVGSDNILFFGTHGLGMSGEGDSCYGFGTSDISLHLEPYPEGGVYCYDPVKSSKGGHAYPYVYQVWVYDANDLLAVKNGTIEAWDVVPYARWELDLPFATGTKTIKGVAYDPSTQRIFVVQAGADNTASQYTPYPIVHVYSLDLAAAPQAEPVVEPAPQSTPIPEPPPVLRLQ